MDGFKMSPYWTMVEYLSCPVIPLIWVHWLLVPILNASLYIIVTLIAFNFKQIIRGLGFLLRSTNDS
jgi:hypothetical protein